MVNGRGPTPISKFKFNERKNYSKSSFDSNWSSSNVQLLELNCQKNLNLFWDGIPVTEQRFFASKNAAPRNTTTSFWTAQFQELYNVKKLLAQSLRDENVKHDIAAFVSHKTKQYDKFSFSANVCHGQWWSINYVCHICNVSIIMSVTLGDGTFEMSLTFIKSCCQDFCQICDDSLLRCLSRSVMGP
jgi:hypothetical protein